MNRKQDLTQGAILPALIKLASPIIATSMVQMAYTLTDMIWLGRLGSDGVAAAGTAGFFVWFGFGVILISKIGTEVTVAQSTGKKKVSEAQKFAVSGLHFNLFSALIYATILLLTREKLISFFRLGDAAVITQAIQYLTVVALGIVFYFVNPIFSGIFNASGDSRTPFWVNSVGLIINMVLDPVLIFGLGPFPKLGVLGAAISTVFAHSFSTIIFIGLLSSKYSPFPDFSFLVKPVMNRIKKIVKIGSPIALHSMMFTIFAILLARIIARWGPAAIAAQKVGAHIEAISWMTAGGFSTALNAFIGQNFGAQKWDRIWKGYFTGLGIVSVVGITSTVLLVFFSKPVFGIFIPQGEAVRFGASYLKILGLSQLFMVWEISTEGAFSGLARTIPPSIVSIVFTGLRVPVAFILASEQLLGLDGVWWSISMSSLFKGFILVSWFILVLKRHPCIVVPKFEYKTLFKWNLKYIRDKRCIDGKL